MLYPRPLRRYPTKHSAVPNDLQSQVFFSEITMDDKKELNNLINLSIKIGQALCDEDTFEETSSKDIVQKWKYQGDIFEMPFLKNSTDKVTIKNCYAQMRKKLREISLEAPSESSMRLVSNFAKTEELVLLDELWEELGSDNKS